jgi:outer membrane protein TolC
VSCSRQSTPAQLAAATVFAQPGTWVWRHYREHVQHAFDLSYEIDLWGRVRAGSSARADAQASVAAFQTCCLPYSGHRTELLHIEGAGCEIGTVVATLDLRREQVQLVRSRFEGGIGNELT